MESDDLLCSRNARPRKALVGRAQWKINQTPSPEERTSKLGGEEGVTSNVLFARGTRALGRASFDARSRGQSEAAPKRSGKRKNSGKDVARCPSCSQNAHDETVLVRCAQEGQPGRSS